MTKNNNMNIIQYLHRQLLAVVDIQMLSICYNNLLMV
jgi:hypothetical protein